VHPLDSKADSMILNYQLSVINYFVWETIFEIKTDLEIDALSPKE
jgi:hypothetical protein